MKLFIAVIISLNLVACITSGEKERESKPDVTPKADSIFLGYGYQERQSESPNMYKTFTFHRGPDTLVVGPEGVFSSDTFSVFIKDEFIKRDLDFSRTLEAIKYGKLKLFDVGNKCLTFKQTGIDTILIDKKPLTISVPIEPCMPFSLSPF
jgi:hypothetical protein